MMNLTHYISP